MTTLAVVFWISAGLLVYAHLGYPLVLWGLARLPARRAEAGAGSGGPPPSVSLIVAAHDEEASILRWVRSTLAFDYPRERLEVIVVSDGSTDRTVEWAVGQGIETATFHIMTPYPGTGLYQRMHAAALELLNSNG